MHHTKSEPNYGRWVIMMMNVGSFLIKKKKNAILVSDLYNGGGYACVGAVGM